MSAHLPTITQECVKHLSKECVKNVTNECVQHLSGGGDHLSPLEPLPRLHPLDIALSDPTQPLCARKLYNVWKAALEWKQGSRSMFSGVLYQPFSMRAVQYVLLS